MLGSWVTLTVGGDALMGEPLTQHVGSDLAGAAGLMAPEGQELQFVTAIFGLKQLVACPISEK
jgi:hypothetical protein